MNKAIIHFRFRQLWKVICEIPVLYLLCIILFTGVIIVVLYRLSATVTGTLLISLFLLCGLYALHVKRRDYHFIYLVEEKPWRIFVTEYLLLSFVFIVIIALHGYLWMGLAIIAGCIVIPLKTQKTHRISKGLPVPSFIPYKAFELRAGFRRYGWFLLFLYLISCVGLFFPYISLAALWLFTLLWMDFFRISEPLSIICANEIGPGRFLHLKIMLYIRLYIFPVFPVCIAYSIIYTGLSWYAMLFCFYGLLNIVLIVVSKYAYYSPQSKISAGNVAITFSLFGMLLPLFLPVTLFYLIKNYLAARRNLIPYLDAYNTQPPCAIR